MLDLETTNLDFGSALNSGNQLLYAYATRVDGGVVVESCGIKEDFRARLADLLGRVDFIVAHNAKFEIQWLMRIGAWKPMPVYDTMLAEAVWAANRRWPLDLDSVAWRRLKERKSTTVADMIHAGVSPETIPQELLWDYCEKDVALTLQVMLSQLADFQGTRLLPVVYTRCLLTPVLADIERNGMTLDAAAVKERYKEYNEKYKDLVRRLAEFTGGVNPASPKQMGAYLYETLAFELPVDYSGNPVLTPSGKRPTDIDTISQLRAVNSTQRDFVSLFSEFGSLKVNTNVLKKLVECVEDAENENKQPILYAYYTQHVAQTHRTTSRGAKYKLQFQNFNRDFKDLFTHRYPGWQVGEADGRQLEFRVAAHLGRDKTALADIHNPDFDVHYQTAEQIFLRPREQITKHERTEVKPKTFRPLYGGNQGTPDEQRYYDFFRRRYHGIYEAQEGWTYEVARTKKLETEWGFIFHWPDCKVSATGRISHRTNIFNYPVQSFATADIIPIGLVCIYYRMLDLKMESFLVNTVHDSVVGEVKEEEGLLFRGICNHGLTYDVFDYLERVYQVKLVVPLGAETKLGTHWGKGDEEKFDVDPVSRELIHLN